MPRHGISHASRDCFPTNHDRSGQSSLNSELCVHCWIDVDENWHAMNSTTYNCTQQTQRSCNCNCAMLASSVCSLSKCKGMGGISDSVQDRKLIGSQTSRYVVRWGCSCNKITEENTVDRATGFPCFIAIPLALCRTWENWKLPEHYFL